MSHDLAVILVHYRTPELVPEALEAMRADLQTSGGGLRVHWLVVDNSGDPGDVERFRALDLGPGEGLEVLVPGENLGYAGALNLAAAQTDAWALVVSNPDVRVLPGCLGALLSGLRSGGAVAGPTFFWDRQLRLRLPPAEPRSRCWELRAARAGESARRAALARRTWRAHSRRHWRSEETLESHHLSGALLAITRDAWQAIGPFDQGYRLYFEETDWLYRAHDAGLTASYVPGARAVHFYNRSGAREPRVQQWFEASRRRFFERRYGGEFLRLLDGLAPTAVGAPAVVPVPGPPRLDPAEIEAANLEAGLWVEISPSPHGFPAAAEQFAGSDSNAGDSPWRLPGDIWDGLEPGVFHLRLVTDEDPGREILHRAFEKLPKD